MGRIVTGCFAVGFSLAAAAGLGAGDLGCVVTGFSTGFKLAAATGAGEVTGARPSRIIRQAAAGSAGLSAPYFSAPK